DLQVLVDSVRVSDVDVGERWLRTGRGTGGELCWWGWGWGGIQPHPFIIITTTSFFKITILIIIIIIIIIIPFFKIIIIFFFNVIIHIATEAPCIFSVITLIVPPPSL